MLECGRCSTRVRMHNKKNRVVESDNKKYAKAIENTMQEKIRIKSSYNGNIEEESKLSPGFQPLFLETSTHEKRCKTPF